MRQLLALLLATLSLPLSAAITGTVMTSDGKPVAGARVMIHAIETPEGRRERLLSASPDFVALGSVQTDAKGAFSLDSPKESVVDLRVELKGYEPISRRIERDEELGAIVIGKRDMTKGTVTAGGKPVANALVVVSYSGDLITRTDEQGRYEAPDIRRARTITVIHRDYAIDEESYFNSATPSEANRTLSPGVALTGRAVAADGTSPVAKATVTVDSGPVATSADDGTFTIAHAPAKWSSITVRKDAFTGTRASGPANKPPLTVRLEKSAAITGRVTDTKTKLPVAGATVRLNVPRRPTAGDVSLLALTDAKGAYTILAPSGTYIVLASHPAYESQMSETAVSAGQQLVKDLAVSQLARVSGVVVDEEKRPIVGATVGTENAGGDRAMMRNPMRMIRGGDSATTGPDGRFSMRVGADSDLILKASKKGFPQAKGDSFRLGPGERKGSVVLVIPNGIAVSGRVLDANGDPLSGVTVVATETPVGRDGGSMIRRMILSGLPGGEEEDLVRSASDGTFTLRVKEGTYDFTFKREGYSEKQVRAQTITAGGANPIETRMEPAVEITGRVTRGGVGVPDVMITTFMGGDASVTTGPDGSFTLSGLTPGVTRVMVMKPQEMLQEQRNLTAPGRDVVIDLPAGGTISGRVVEKGTKKPIMSFQAGVSTSGGGGGMIRMGPPMLKSFTADDGSFTLEHVPAGAINLVANAPGYSSGRMTVNVEDGKSVSDVLVELEQGARLTGRVTSSSGTPLADVSVSIQPSVTGGFATRGMMPRTTTDANGEYVLDSVEPGEETVNFSHPKHVDLAKKVTIKGRDTRLDVTLSGGQRVTGVVVTESGVPVPDAEVDARGGGDGGETRTNASGTFEFESMAPGRYRFSAAKAGYAAGRVDDFDISSGTPLRIVLGTGGTIYGRVTGLSEAELASTSVRAFGSTGGGGASTSAVDPQGNFRIEGVPAGNVRVSAQVSTSPFGSQRSSPFQTVEMTAGGSQQVNIEFRSDTVIRGRVTRNGVPLPTATVQFWPRSGGSSSSASASADEQGNYSVSGLEPGEYSVTVRDQRFTPYQTTYTVRSSATYDIEYKTGMVRGRVLNSLSNDPITNANVQLRPISGDMRSGSFGASTDSNGTFSVDSVPAGTYRVLVTGEGFANHSSETTINESGRDDLEFRLTRNEGIHVKVVDARDGRPLNANIVAFDMQGRVVDEGGMMMRFGGATEETRTLQLAPGQYNATISVPSGTYAPVHARLTSPGSPTIYMSPGGTIRIASKHSERRKYFLLDANGTPYPHWVERMTPRELQPGISTLDRIAPGTYTVQLLNDNETPAERTQVTVREGEMVDVAI